jgi:hypothetical protein
MPGGDRTARAGQRSALALAALELALEGHPLIPLHTPSGGRCSCGYRCGRVGKHPRGLLGLRSASSDPERVEAWWWAQPEANIGLRCDRLLVFDLDGPAGRDSLSRLQEELGELPASREQRSGRGWHLLFGLAGEAAIGNSTAALGDPPGLDLRAGARGYIVAAPSLHENGRTYRWRDRETPIAPLPRAWLERLQRPQPSPSMVEPGPFPSCETSGYGLVALRRELAKVRTAREGAERDAQPQHLQARPARRRRRARARAANRRRARDRARERAWRGGDERHDSLGAHGRARLPALTETAMSASCKIVSLLYTGLAGSFLSNVNNPSSQPSSRARARGADELSELFSGPLRPRRTGLFGWRNGSLQRANSSVTGRSPSSRALWRTSRAGVRRCQPRRATG